MRVIALLSFTDAAGEAHPYGHEFEMAEGAELDQAISDGLVRRDDRRELFDYIRPALSPPTQSEDVAGVEDDE